jgi:hypothetical protein
MVYEQSGFIPTSHSHPARRTSLIRRVCLGVASAMVAILLTGGGGGGGTAAATAPSTQPITRLVFHMDTTARDTRGWTAWKADADRKFPAGYVMVVGHGYTLFGQWCVMPTADPVNPVRPYAPLPVPVEFFAECLRNDFPTLPIIFVTCNESHDLIHVPNVYYSPDVVWVRPDDDCDFGTRFMRHMGSPEIVGDFEHMVHTPGGK